MSENGKWNSLKSYKLNPLQELKLDIPEEPEWVKELLKLDYMVVRLKTSYWEGSDGSLNCQKKIYPLIRKSNPIYIDQFNEDISCCGGEETWKMFNDSMTDKKDGLYRVTIKGCGDHWEGDYDYYYEIEEYE